MLRITSGIHRGRLIQTLPGPSTRPTQERLRQAWLNSLQTKLPDARILDLFSGSGALGFEALSRGAAYVVFVEENPKAARVIQENAKTLGLQDQCEVLVKRAEKCFQYFINEPPFDLVFMDPPYQKGFEEKILGEWPWNEILAEGGRFCIESAYRKEGAFLPTNHMEIIRHERYGDSQLTFYSRVLASSAESES